MLVRNASIPEAVPKVLVRNAVLLRVAKALSAISVVKIRERAKAPSCLEGSLSSSVPSAASAETLERVQNGRQADGSGGCGKSSPKRAANRSILQPSPAINARHIRLLLLQPTNRPHLCLLPLLLCAAARR